MPLGNLQYITSVYVVSLKVSGDVCGGIVLAGVRMELAVKPLLLFYDITTEVSIETRMSVPNVMSFHSNPQI